jgi:glycosyltransferase involved in cell wall biosynthesis
MKILLATPFYPPEVGGIQCHTSNIVRQLSARHDITVVTNTLAEDSSGKEKPNVVRIPFITLGYPYETLSNFRVATSFSKLQETFQLGHDVVHVHGHHYPLTWLCTALAKKHGVPLVLTLHGMYALNPDTVGGKTLVEEIFNRTVFRLLLGRTNSVIGLTRTIAEYARRYGKYGGHTKYYVVPNGVDMEKYNRNLQRKYEYRIKYGLPLDRRIVLFRGRFTHVKGMIEAVSAAESVLRSDEGFFFVFVGAGPLAEMPRILASKFKQRVRVFGWLPADAVPELYIASDTYMLPSRWEALPITLLEAMAARLHVVSVPVGGIMDVLKGYPFKTIIAQLTSESLAAALRNAPQHDTGIVNSTASNLEEYLSFFDWSNIARKVETVYCDTCSDQQTVNP